jgi:CDP-diacylglycerol--glycerol-3-phosphate 3-phosphatidyltransferase
MNSALSEQRATSQNVFTVSNFLSVLRPLLVIPYIYFDRHNDGFVCFILLLIAIATDWFDGRVARWTNTVSDLGKILDPLCDKVAGAAMVIYLSLKGDIPMWFVAFLLMRDVLIFAGGIYAKRKAKIITTSLPAGKWAVGFLALMLVGLLWYHPPFDTALLVKFSLWSATILLAISFIQYALRFRDILAGKSVRNL